MKLCLIRKIFEPLYLCGTGVFKQKVTNCNKGYKTVTLQGCFLCDIIKTENKGGISMKRTIALFIAVLLILGLFPFGVVAESSVQEVQKKVDILPELSGVESVEGESFAQAFVMAKETVYALAMLTEEEMERVVNYQKAFQLYIDLIGMQAQALLPKEPITLENYTQQNAALKQVHSLLFEEEPLYLLAEYTYDTVNEHFCPPETTTGFVSLYYVQVAYHSACDIRDLFLNSLT